MVAQRRESDNPSKATSTRSEAGSGEGFLDYFAGHDGGAFGPPIMQEGHIHVIEAERVKNGSVNVVDVGALFNSTESDVIGCAEHLAAFDPTARHPHRESP